MDEFNELKAMLADWPNAVPDFIICNTDEEDDKNERAEGIANWYELPLSGKKVLDFGCGEGHLAKQFSKDAEKSVGYDIEKKGVLTWGKDDGYLLSTDFSVVEQHAPYDEIVVYDVLDHCEDPEAALMKIKSCCKNETRIHVQCHPWIGRHGGHMYHQLNKAWLHVFFKSEELEKLELNPVDVPQKVLAPINTYTGWFRAAGFRVENQNIVQQPVENFFKTSPLLKSRLPEAWRDKDGFPEWQMSQSFNHYILRIV